MKNSPEFKEKLEELDSDALWDIMNNEFNRHVFTDFAGMFDGTPEFNEWAYDKITSEVSEDELDEGGWVLDEGSYWDILCEYFNEDSVFADFALTMQGTPEFDEWAIDQIYRFVSEEDLMENGWIEDDREDRFYEKLESISGEFYAIRPKEIDSYEEEEYLPDEDLYSAISNAMDFIGEGINNIVIDADRNVYWELDSYYRERYAMGGKDRFEVIESGLTDYAKSLLK